MNRKQRNAARMHRVTLYNVNRSYGGREEGGWWYDTGWPLRRVATFRVRSKAWQLANVINDELRAAEQGMRHRDPGSVLYAGRVEARVEQHEPQPYPQRRPYYC